MTAKPKSTVNAWSDDKHADFFDYLSCQPRFIVRRFYEGFNEARLLKSFYDDVRGTRFFEIGCATGELYRYISNFMPKFEYHGFDISAPAIQRAKQKYPKARFSQLQRQSEDGTRPDYSSPDRRGIRSA